MGIATTTTALGGSDYRWLTSEPGKPAKSGTLDYSTFTLADHFPDGFFVSGTPLTFNSGSGLYEPYDDGTGDTPADLAGFLYHDTAVDSTNDVTAAILPDATIDASALPVSTTLEDGRYICDLVSTLGS